MRLRTRVAERILLRKVGRRIDEFGFLHRLARADGALLPLFPDSVARSLASVGFAILFSGVLIFIATTSLVLSKNFAERSALNWAIALAVGGLFCVSYVVIAHFVIGLSRFARAQRYSALVCAVALSLTFSFVCAVSFKERLFPREVAAKTTQIHFEIEGPDRDHTIAGSRHDAPLARGDTRERAAAKRRTDEKLAAENVVATALLMTFFFFVSWAPFFVLQSLRNSDYGCLIAAIDGTNRIVRRASVASGEKS